MIGTRRLRLPRQFRLDLPLRRDASARFLPWIIALMVYLAAMGGTGLIWLRDTIGRWDASLAGAVSLQIPADTDQPRLDMALAAVRQTQGVLSARLLPPDEATKLLRPWLGSNLAIVNLPLPHLVDIKVDPHATIDYATLRSHLDSMVPGASLDNSRSWLGSVRDFALRIEGVVTAGVIAVTILIIAIIIFTARIGLAIHGSVIELLHLLGAQDAYIARQFQIYALGLGLRGGLIGVVAAVVTMAVLGPAGQALALPVPIATYGVFDWRAGALLITAIVTAGGIAMMTARITVLRQLARMP